MCTSSPRPKSSALKVCKKHTEEITPSDQSSSSKTQPSPNRQPHIGPRPPICRECSIEREEWADTNELQAYTRGIQDAEVAESREIDWWWFVALILTLAQFSGYSADHIGILVQHNFQYRPNAEYIWDLNREWNIRRRFLGFMEWELKLARKVAERYRILIPLRRVGKLPLYMTPRPISVDFATRWRNKSNDNLFPGYNRAFRQKSEEQIQEFLVQGGGPETLGRLTEMESVIIGQFGPIVKCMIEHTLLFWAPLMNQLLRRSSNPIMRLKEQDHIDLICRLLEGFAAEYSRVYGCVEPVPEALENDDHCDSAPRMLIQSTAYGIKTTLGLMMADRLHVIQLRRRNARNSMGFTPIDLEEFKSQPEEEQICPICREICYEQHSEEPAEIPIRLWQCCGQMIGCQCLIVWLCDENVFGELNETCPICRETFPDSFLVKLLTEEQYMRRLQRTIMQDSSREEEGIRDLPMPLGWFVTPSDVNADSENDAVGGNETPSEDSDSEHGPDESKSGDEDSDMAPNSGLSGITAVGGDETSCEEHDLEYGSNEPENVEEDSGMSSNSGWSKTTADGGNQASYEESDSGYGSDESRSSDKDSDIASNSGWSEITVFDEDHCEDNKSIASPLRPATNAPSERLVEDETDTNRKTENVATPVDEDAILVEILEDNDTKAVSKKNGDSMADDQSERLHKKARTPPIVFNLDYAASLVPPYETCDGIEESTRDLVQYLLSVNEPGPGFICLIRHLMGIKRYDILKEIQHLHSVSNNADACDASWEPKVNAKEVEPGFLHIIKPQETLESPPETVDIDI